jgi:hypothetical protein
MQQPHIIPRTSELQDTSRAITPIASFSETEEGNKSDDNDVRLQWQEERGRGKKRASPKTTRAPTLKLNKSQERSNNSIQLTATNRTEILRHAETEGNGRHERQDPAPTPMFVPRITNIRQLNK